MNNQFDAPFNLPVSRSYWLVLLAGGVLLAFLVMGLVYEVVPGTLYGPISIAETAGLAVYCVWSFVVIGPFSPFKVEGGGRR